MLRRAYIKFSDDRAYATGESSAVNISQAIYMIPVKLLTNGSKNPSALNDSSSSGVKFTCDINENNFLHMICLPVKSTRAEMLILI